MKKRKGFTMVEIVVAMAIILVIFTLIYEFLFGNATDMNKIGSWSQFMSDIRMTMLKARNDIRESILVSEFEEREFVITLKDGNSLNDIKYEFDKSKGELIRTVNGKNKKILLKKKKENEKFGLVDFGINAYDMGYGCTFHQDGSNQDKTNIKFISDMSDTELIDHRKRHIYKDSFDIVVGYGKNNVKLNGSFSFADIKEIVSMELVFKILNNKGEKRDIKMRIYLRVPAYKRMSDNYVF